MEAEINNWTKRFARDIQLGGKVSRPSREHIDLLLSWLAGKESLTSMKLRDAFSQVSLTENQGKRSSLKYIDNLLFKKSNASPLETLGLESAVTTAEIKIRYRKLMQIYHPDRAMIRGALSTKRAEQINIAYASLENYQPTAPNKYNSAENLNRVRSETTNIQYSKTSNHLRIRSKIGSAKRTKRVVFTILVVLAAILLGLIYISSIEPEYSPRISQSLDSGNTLPKSPDATSQKVQITEVDTSITAEIAETLNANDLPKPTNENKSIESANPKFNESTGNRETQENFSNESNQKLLPKTLEILDLVKPKTTSKNTESTSQIIKKNTVQKSSLSENTEIENSGSLNVKTIENQSFEDNNEKHQESIVKVSKDEFSSKQLNPQEGHKEPKEPAVAPELKQLMLLLNLVNQNDLQSNSKQLRKITRHERKLGKLAIVTYVSGIENGNPKNIYDALAPWVVIYGKNYIRSEWSNRFDPSKSNLKVNKYNLTIDEWRYVGQNVIKLIADADIEFEHNGIIINRYRGTQNYYIKVVNNSAEIIKISKP